MSNETCPHCGADREMNQAHSIIKYDCGSFQYDVEWGGEICRHDRCYERQEEDKVAQDDTPMGFIAYHAKTENVALYRGPDGYWIGAFSPHTAQHLGSLVDPYVWVKGNYATLEEGMAALAECTGNEF